MAVCYVNGYTRHMGYYEGKFYYLAAVPTGKTSEMSSHDLFSTPPGLELLDGQDINYGGVNTQDFIARYVVVLTALILLSMLFIWMSSFTLIMGVVLSTPFDTNTRIKATPF